MKTQEELTALKEECETLTTKLKELSDEELKEVNGGFKYDPNETYLGYDASAFGNLKINDRVKRYNILGTYVWHEGTVKGFTIASVAGIIGRSYACRVLVKWDDVGTSRADGCLEEFPSNLTKI